MTVYKVGYKASTKEVEVKAGSLALTGGFTQIGTYEHTPENNEDGYDANKVMIHFVQDLLYAEGITNLQELKIIGDYIIEVTAISSTPPTPSIAVAATQQITNAFTPTDATDKTVEYSSSDPTKATVSATGLITGVAAGSATITVRAKGTGGPVVQDTVAVTVTA